MVRLLLPFNEEIRVDYMPGETEKQIERLFTELGFKPEQRDSLPQSALDLGDWGANFGYEMEILDGKGDEIAVYTRATHILNRTRPQEAQRQFQADYLSFQSLMFYTSEGNFLGRIIAHDDEPTAVELWEDEPNVEEFNRFLKEAYPGKFEGDDNSMMYRYNVPFYDLVETAAGEIKQFRK